MSKKAHRIILVLGGARSGKSTYAQQTASSLGKKVLYCATAEPLDADMKKRINQHRKMRPDAWQTMEAIHDTAKKLEPVAHMYDAVIIDCVTVLVANLVGKTVARAKREQNIYREIGDLIGLMQKRESTYFLVSNEVGLGIVPPYRLGRDYRDILGKVNQLLASHADEIYFMIAGIPARVK